MAGRFDNLRFGAVNVDSMTLKERTLERCKERLKARGRRCHVLQQTASPSRRFNSRIETPGGVWVYWRSNEPYETARVRDVSLGGLFVETAKPRAVGSTAKVDFLVQEGQIRADAVVRHVEPGRGLGLKFTAVSDGDRPHFTALLNRLRSLSRRELKAFWKPSTVLGGLWTV
jgi:hypothetical protein